ncbi:MAG: integrase core domain-containing protein [Verrucomicrobia bacterium]|nr:integrase core domain-containing protein [Verrucomicrobiota bacterium]
MWTVDFKGSFYTADRRRVCALTVRDLATCYVLAVRQVRPTEQAVGKVLRALFARYGQPRAIRSDNGPPFGSTGPRGWTPLSLWWVRQGIRVEFGRPACPQDNAGHEQMHGVLKQATAQPPAKHLVAQQRRFDRWRREYNHARPHAALGQCPPAKRYRPRRRRTVRVPVWAYPPGCELLRLDARGRIRWGARTRHIGRAFARQQVGLKAKTSQLAEVYFGPHLLGTLHLADLAGLRPVQWRHSHHTKGRGLRPLP